MTDTRQSLSDLKDLTKGEGEAPAAAAPGTEASEGEASAEPAQPEAPLREQQLDAQGRAYATGRRKDAVARVWLKPGTGQISMTSSPRSPAAAFPARPARSSTASARR